MDVRTLITNSLGLLGSGSGGLIGLGSLLGSSLGGGRLSCGGSLDGTKT